MTDIDVSIPDWQERKKLWLNEEHYIRWVTYEGEIIGGILGHKDTGNIYPKDFCEGAFYFEGNKFHEKHEKDGDRWKFNNNFEKPTLTPSFLCHCKLCHIFITDGKVIDSGCKHR